MSIFYFFLLNQIQIMLDMVIVFQTKAEKEKKALFFKLYQRRAKGYKIELFDVLFSNG